MVKYFCYADFPVEFYDPLEDLLLESSEIKKICFKILYGSFYKFVLLSLHLFLDRD